MKPWHVQYNSDSQHFWLLLHNISLLQTGWHIFSKYNSGNTEYWLQSKSMTRVVTIIKREKAPQCCNSCQARLKSYLCLKSLHTLMHASVSHPAWLPPSHGRKYDYKGHNLFIIYSWITYCNLRNYTMLVSKVMHVVVAWLNIWLAPGWNVLLAPCGRLMFAGYWPSHLPTIDI